jgi:hypothetical protein
MVTMQLRKLGDGFLIGGVLVGALAAVGYVADIVPDLPPAVLKLVIYKLTFIGGLGLVVFGAFLRRIASRDAAGDLGPPSRPAMHDVDAGPAAAALREPSSLEEHQLRESRQPAPLRDRRPR